MKILVVSCSGMGNTLLATPMLQELRRRLPDAQIDLLVRRIYFAAPVAHTPWFNVIHHLETSPMSVIAQLRAQRYDVSIPCFPGRRWHYPVLLQALGARTRLSHSYPGCLLQPLLSTWAIPADPAMHDTHQNLQLLRYWDWDINYAEPFPQLTYALAPGSEAWVSSYLHSRGLEQRNLIGVHAFVGDAPHRRVQKQAPLSVFLDRIYQLAEPGSHEGQMPPAILLFGSGDEIRQNLEFRDQLAKAHIQAEVIEAPLDLTAALIARCSHFISNSTGLMHIAAAFRIPMTAFLHNDPLRCSPLYPEAKIVLSGTPHTYPFRD